MNSPDDVDFHLEIALSWKGIPLMSRNTMVSKNLPFSEILSSAIQELILDAHPNLAEWEIITGRPLNTPFFPIASNEQQQKVWEEKLKQTQRIPIPVSDLPLVYDQIIQKYHTTDFHLMKKP